MAPSLKVGFAHLAPYRLALRDRFLGVKLLQGSLYLVDSLSRIQIGFALQSKGQSGSRLPRRSPQGVEKPAPIDAIACGYP